MVPGFRALLAAVTASWLVLRLSSAGFACLSNPCVYGICIDDLNSTYTCYCIDGYTGIHCQTNWDECWSSPCLNGGTCHDGIAAFNCSCLPGFLGDLCEENVDECSSNPCLNNATCFDVANGYTCQCLPGYSGVHCEIDIAVCNSTEEAQCHNGAMCVEGPGMTFTCICTPGWKGKQCDEVIDECASTPCQNGAVCINMPAGYACACLFGFTGHNCDTELQICEMSPCENNALCLNEDSISVCYCVPDYHGDRCQFQYDECQLGPRCWNGGTCIDGVDNYTCSCPPKLTGRHCECLILDDNQLDCTYKLTTSELPLTTVHYFKSTTESSLEDRSSQITHYFITSESPLSSYVPISSESTLGITYENISKPITDYTTLTTESIIEFVEKTPTTTELVQTSPKYMTEVTTEYFTTEFFSNASTSFSEIDIIGTTIFPSSIKPRLPTDKGTTETAVLSNTTESTIFEYTDITHTTPFEPSYHRTDYEITQKERTEEPVTTFVPISSIQTETIKTIFQPKPTEITKEIFSTTKILPPDSSEHSLSSHSIPSLITVPMETTTSVESTIEYSTSKTLPEVSVPDFSTHYYPSATTTESETETSYGIDVDCSKLPCLNGGKCVVEKGLAKCSCQFGWTGFHCEEHTGIHVVAFTGVSFLTHSLSNRSSTVIGLSARTLSPTGLLFYAQTTSYMHMALYLHNGLLKFLFSCGLQTMLFSELKDQVNDGFLLNILAVIELVPTVSDPLQCSASLRLNDTLAMSGEQRALNMIRDVDVIHSHQLFLGGLPPHLLHLIDLPVTTGITGCMDQLQIDGEPRHIYREAKDGFEVSECASLACLSNPCYGGATCVEYKQKWNCLCPSGYVGITCNQSVCANNPCQFGGTCAEYPGSGFICLCPFGKHGLFCQNDLEIGQPSYSSSIRGISSFTAYPLPGAVHYSFEIRFRFSPTSMDQIALMLFIGQGRSHDSTSDHLAVSFIKGYVVLTWNLGSGPRRIFTPRSLLGKPGRAHAVRLGRTGQHAWLQVDNLENVTGHSPGRLSELNTQAVMFVGGHKAINFSGLPHDLPLHNGFSGCIYGVEIRTGQVTVTVGQLRQRAIVGRGVGQCGTQQCHNATCLNGGACLDHGATFTCLCKSGWFGPVCALRQNPCDSTHHNCSFGSTCIPLESGYTCDCPLGRTGQFCEKVEKLSDVNFSGQRSYLSLSAPDFHLQQICIDFELRPLKNRGLVVFSGEGSRTFLSLSLHGGVLELRVQPIGGKRRLDEVVVVRSGRVLPLGVWHRVRAGRYGQRLFLSVDGSVNAGTLLFGETILPTITPLYIGGIPDLSNLPYGTIADFPVSFTGCIRRLSVNWKHITLDETKVLDARNIADCDGTACGGDFCQNGGTCWLDTTFNPHCTCTKYYTGNKCETLLTCTDIPCQNNAQCIKEKGSQPSCRCSSGWGGHFCELEVPVGAPHFSGDSFMVVDSNPYLHKRGDLQSEQTRMNEIDFLYVNFSTAQQDGMILWSSLDQEFVGIGVENGLMKIVWAWESTDVSVVKIPGIWVADGGWHDIILNFSPENITLFIDINVLTFETPTKRPINSDGVFYLGGFPQESDIEDETHGLFRVQFNGCIRELSWTESSGITDFTNYIGENIGSCDAIDL